MKTPTGDVPMVPVSFAVEPDVRQALKALARQQDTHISGVVRDLVLWALKERDASGDASSELPGADNRPRRKAPGSKPSTNRRSDGHATASAVA